MKHRHINTDKFTIAAIDSVLERGDLDDWRALFREAKTDRTVARNIMLSVRRHRDDPTLELAAWLARRVNPKAFGTLLS